MFNQYFGQYLFNQGILTSEQLYNIFEYQGTVSVKLGTLAITSGLMTAAQVEEVFELQKHIDSQFGEIAASKGYLTTAQIEQLLNSQKNSQVTLSQAITDKGYLSLSEIEKHLNDFYNQEGNVMSAANIKAIEANDIDAIVRMFLNFSQAGEAAKWYYEYVSLLLRNSIRFIGENPAIRHISYGQNEQVKKPSSKQITIWLITQKIPEPVNLVVSLTMEENTLLEISRKFNEKTRRGTVVKDSAADIISKFFDMHNNLFLSTYLKKEIPGENIEPSPCLASPEIFKQRLPFNTNGYRIPIVYSFGSVDILIETFEQAGTLE